jgi:hypothetical protein
MAVRFLPLPLIVLFLANSSVSASLSEKQARKLIARMAGADLPNEAVRVKQVSGNDAEAEATAEVETAFRVVQDEGSRWHVAEVRLGQDRWQEVPLDSNPEGEKCTAPDLATRGVAGLSTKRARCVIAGLLGVKLPSDAVRIRNISSLGLPFAENPSALVVALVEVDIRFSREGGSWRVSRLRTGDHQWIEIDSLMVAINAARQKRARHDLQTVAGALEVYRKDFDFYLVSDNHRTLIEHLSPRYLPRVIRLDPWGHPYRYLGERDRFQLRSDGPDGKENTADDIVVSK